MGIAESSVGTGGTRVEGDDSGVVMMRGEQGTDDDDDDNDTVLLDVMVTLLELLTAGLGIAGVMVLGREPVSRVSSAPTLSVLSTCRTAVSKS